MIIFPKGRLPVYPYSHQLRDWVIVKTLQYINVEVNSTKGNSIYNDKIMNCKAGVILISITVKAACAILGTLLFLSI